MMKLLRFLVGVLLVAAITHGALLYFGPSVLMSRLMGKLAVDGLNTTVHAPRPGTAPQDEPFLVPDILYSLCVYDVSQHPLRITADVPANTYWSIAFYDASTNNFRTINDGEATAGAVLLVLQKDTASGTGAAGAENIAAPTDRGVVVFRTLINDDARLDELDAIRKQAKCKPI